MSGPNVDGCRCEACLPSIDVAYDPTDTRAWLNYRMIVCAMCGNKRCPHATDHRNACANSNDPGRAGSSYEQCSKFVRAIEPSPAPVQPDPKEGAWHWVRTDAVDWTPAKYRNGGWHTTGFSSGIAASEIGAEIVHSAQTQAELVVQDDQDAARFVYLMSYLFSSNREVRNDLVGRLSGMTYSDGCAVIDAMRGTK